MIAFERLALLVLGELPEADAVAVEDHVLACDGCAAIVERLVDLGERVAEVTRAGGAALLAGRPLVDRLERDRMVTRTYRIVPGGEVACTVDAADVYTAILLALDTRGISGISGIRRIDLLFDAPSGVARIEDLPFDPERGEVVYVQPAEYLRTLPTERKTLRLVAVEDAGDRVLGEYVLDHTAFAPQAQR